MIERMVVRSVTTLVLLVALSGCEYIDDIPVGARYIAKNIRSGLFVSGYDETLLIDRYVTTIVPPLKPIWNIEVDRHAKQVLVTDKLFNRLYEAIAVYRPGLGCVNVRNESVEQLQAQGDFLLLQKELPVNDPWPYGAAGVDSSFVDIDTMALLSEIVEGEFVNPVGKLKHTTGVAIVKNSNLVMEQYAGG